MKVTIPEGVSGKWRVERFTVERNSIERLRCAIKGRDIEPGQYTRLLHGSNLIMSDTPAEIRDLAPVLSRTSQESCERVLIHGLGLGVLVSLLAYKPHIKSIDVVELSEDVIALVGKHVQDACGKRLVIHHGDCRYYEWSPSVRWDVVWHDIWDHFPNEDDTKEVQRLRRRFGRKCVWQGVWGMPR